MRRLTRADYNKKPIPLARFLLNKILVHGDCSGRIVETEAYGGFDDPGSHAFRGMTPRTVPMFGQPGLAYVYFTYGMHWCTCVVSAPNDVSGAVLIRALNPLTGIDQMYSRRAIAKRDVDLCSGPAKLSSALAIDSGQNALDLCDKKSVLFIADDGTKPPRRPMIGPRIGMNPGMGDTFPWRFGVPRDPNLSKPFPSQAELPGEG